MGLLKEGTSRSNVHSTLYHQQFLKRGKLRHEQSKCGARDNSPESGAVPLKVGLSRSKWGCPAQSGAVPLKAGRLGSPILQLA